MIGIKTKNQLLAQTLTQLMPDKMEIFNPNHTYSALIKDTQENKKEALPTLYIGAKESGLQTPFSLNQLETALRNLTSFGQDLTYFKWYSGTKELSHKKTQQIFYLTQKEAELIDFLIQCPQHKATKEQILNEVWHYHKKAKTHTLQSHIYTLNKKLGKTAKDLFKYQHETLILI